MMTKISALISDNKFNPLRKREDRQKLAVSIQQVTNYFSAAEILSFLDEMRGLDLRKIEDRQIFLKFLETWIPMEDRS